MLDPDGKGKALANARDATPAVVVAGRAAPSATDASARTGASCCSILESSILSVLSSWGGVLRVQIFL